MCCALSSTGPSFSVAQGFGQAVQGAMRGPSEWTVGERELFAAFTSRMNKCMF